MMNNKTAVTTVQQEKQGLKASTPNAGSALVRISEEAFSGLKQSGWFRASAGWSRYIKPSRDFYLLMRTRKISLKDGQIVLSKFYTKCSSRDLVPKHVSDRSETDCEEDIRGEEYVNVIGGVRAAPDLADFKSYSSLNAIRSEKASLVIAFDSEWYYPSGYESDVRSILSWQFACVWQGVLYEFVFMKRGTSNRDVNLEIVLACILDYLRFPSYDTYQYYEYAALCSRDKRGNLVEKVFAKLEEAKRASIAPYDDGKTVHKKRSFLPKDYYPVTLLCHAGAADITTLDQSGKYHKDLLIQTTDIQGGLPSLKPTLFYANSILYENNKGHHIYVYPIRISISDTMCHAPAGKKSLDALGKVLGWHKLELLQGQKNHMDQLMINDPKTFIEYASNDSVVTLLYAAALYGYNRGIPVTITSAAARVCQEQIADFLGCEDTADYNRVYRGMQKVKRGKIMGRGLRYIEASNLNPISPNVAIVQHFCEEAYHGGYNACSEVGYFPYMTYDYDLANAYPTAMCVVPDVNWEVPVRQELSEQTLTMDIFKGDDGCINPLTMVVAYVTFTFPATVKYPCIPVVADGIPIYPRTSNGLDGVYACGPELYLALKLGADVYVKRGYMLNTLTRNDMSTSYSLRYAVKQLVVDRKLAKENRGKGSLEELILKTMTNSLYGKTAQSVIQKRKWDAVAKEMVLLDGSILTNPASACMTTSIVRAELLAVQNQCSELGYMACSVTTDGFISNIGEETLKGLDLYGLRSCMEEARSFLTDGADPELWEIKHQQNDLINFTTRGNVSLSPGGVCAHNGASSGCISDSYEDRLWLMTQVLSRTGKVESVNKEWPSFRELTDGKQFAVKTVSRQLSMDFDMKRRPLLSSIQTTHPVVEGTKYEIANLTTEPFDTMEEFLQYRKRKENSSKALRTEVDWHRFFAQPVCAAAAKVRDFSWYILFNCVAGHRAGLWEIPALNQLPPKERYLWINRFNESDREFKDSDWKNAGKKSRHGSIPDRETLDGKLREMQEAEYE